MLSIYDVAKHWQVTPASVRAWIRGGRLKAARMARQYRLTWEDVWACELGGIPRGMARARYQTPLLTKADLARATRVSTRTVERWVCAGLPTRSIGALVRFNAADSAAWLQQTYGLTVAVEAPATGASRTPDSLLAPLSLSGAE